MNNIADITSYIRETLADSEEIEAYCRANFDDAPQTVFLGADIERPVQRENMPAIMIQPFTIAMQNEKRTYGFNASIAIVDETVIASRILSGSSKIAQLSEIVAEELILMPFKISVKIEEMPPTAVFPVFYALVKFEIEIKKPLRPVRARRL